MEKVTKIILILLVVAVSGYTISYFLAPKEIAPVNIVPGARTLYEGHVNIETVSLLELKTKLEKADIYHTTDADMIVIYPHGPGFGPLSFTVTNDTLKASKDIPGIPDPEKYKKEIRQDVQDVGGIITIKEDTWKISKPTYPWTVIY